MCYAASLVNLVDPLAGEKNVGHSPKSMSLRSSIVPTTAAETLHHAEVPAHQARDAVFQEGVPVGGKM